MPRVVRVSCADQMVAGRGPGGRATAERAARSISRRSAQGQHFARLCPRRMSRSTWPACGCARSSTRSPTARRSPNSNRCRRFRWAGHGDGPMGEPPEPQLRRSNKPCSRRRISSCVGMLKDAFSQEVFIYGGAEFRGRHCADQRNQRGRPMPRRWKRMASGDAAGAHGRAVQEDAGSAQCPR